MALPVTRTLISGYLKVSIVRNKSFRTNLKAKVKLNETALDKISSQFKTLNDSFEELKRELHDARCKVDEMESSVQKHSKQIEVYPY